MRISFANQKTGTLHWINQRREDIANLTDMISSQKKLSAPSDAPSAWAQAMDFKHGLREYEAILQNIDFASGWNNATDSALNGVSDLLSQARQVAIRASSPSGMDESQPLVSQLDGIIKNLVSTANAQYGDQYVFAGTNFSSPPFSMDDTTGVVTYSGDGQGGVGGQINVRTNRGTTGSYAINLTGVQAFNWTSGTSNIISEVWQLKDAIQNGDSTTITDKIGTLEEAYDYISNQSAVVGGRLSTLDQRKSAINIIKTNTTSSLSDIEDTNLPDAITRLTQASTAYEAALKVTGMLDNLNLTYFLA